MKVRTRILMGGLAVLAFTLSVIFFACKKNVDHSDRTIKEVVAASDKKMRVSLDGNAASSRANPCEGGEIIFLQIEWDLATCRSNCTRGIGFRCGKRLTYGCKSGALDIYTIVGCPNGASSFSRNMKADISFYSDGNLKLTFLKEVPASEAGNVNFEIEENDLHSFPDGMLLNGQRFQGFKTIIGTYKIDYSDGIYGSVTIPIQFVSKR